MRRKETLYAVIGGIVGAVLTMAAGGFALRGGQNRSDSVFEKVTCRELEVVDSEGNRRVVLSEGVSEEGLWGGSVIVYGKDATPRARMISAEEGGVVGAAGKNRNSGVSMVASEGGGIIMLGDADGVRVGMYCAARGGRVVVEGNDGKNRAIMGVDKHGNGVVRTWGKDGNRLATLGTQE